jgi:hypothetical protein
MSLRRVIHRNTSIIRGRTMKTLIIYIYIAVSLVLVFCSVLGLSGTIWAHTPPGVVYSAPAIPDDKIPTFDGDLSDWAWFPKEAIVTRDTAPRRRPNIDAGVVSKEDFDCVIYGPAWIPKLNMWAFAVGCHDRKRQGDDVGHLVRGSWHLLLCG